MLLFKTLLAIILIFSILATMVAFPILFLIGGIASLWLFLVAPR